MILRNLALDLRADGIAVAVLSPGVVNTSGEEVDMAAMSPEMRRSMVDIDTSVDGMMRVMDELAVEGSGTWYRYNGEVFPQRSHDHALPGRGKRVCRQVPRLCPGRTPAFRRLQLTCRQAEAGVRVSMLRPRLRWSSISAAQPIMRASRNSMNAASSSCSAAIRPSR